MGEEWCSFQLLSPSRDFSCGFLWWGCVELHWFNTNFLTVLPERKMDYVIFAYIFALIIWFLSFILSMWYITFIDCYILNHPCFTRINPIGPPWLQVHWICCLDWFTSILLVIYINQGYLLLVFFYKLLFHVSLVLRLSV